MLGRELTLRSQTVEGVYQEFWGALIAYNLIRLEMAKAALQARHAPEELSFVRALHTVQYEMTWAAVTPLVQQTPSAARSPAQTVQAASQRKTARAQLRSGRQVQTFPLHRSIPDSRTLTERHYARKPVFSKRLPQTSANWFSFRHP